MLLRNLGSDAARYAFVFGPIGLPSPWQWAPLYFSACSGILMNASPMMISTEQGLVGKWSYQVVKLKKVHPLKSDADSYPNFVIKVLGSLVNYMEFSTTNGSEIFTTVYHMETDLSSWDRETLMLLGPSSEVNIDNVADHSWYSLGSVDKVTEDGMFKMHRVGSVAAKISRSKFLSCAKHCDGILS